MGLEVKLLLWTVGWAWGAQRSECGRRGRNRGGNGRPWRVLWSSPGSWTTSRRHCRTKWQVGFMMCWEKSQTPDSTVWSPTVWAPALCSLVSLNGTPVTHYAPAPQSYLLCLEHTGSLKLLGSCSLLSPSPCWSDKPELKSWLLKTFLVYFQTPWGFFLLKHTYHIGISVLVCVCFFYWSCRYFKSGSVSYFLYVLDACIIVLYLCWNTRF